MTCAALSGDFNMFEAYIRGLAEELENTPSAHNSLNQSTTEEAKSSSTIC